MRLHEIARTLGVRIPRDPHDLSHEIAHWLCAAPKRRKLPCYGLGCCDGFVCEHLEVSLGIGSGASHDEEQSASALGICLLWSLGMRKQARRTVKEHSWDLPYADNDFDAALDRAASGIALLHRRCGIRIVRPAKWE